MKPIYRHFTAALAVLAVGFGSACEREGAEEDLPIVVEESGPIALGDPDTTAFDEEVQLVDEAPQVVTRTVYVRERPAPAPTRTEPSNPAPVAPPRVSAIPAGTSVPLEILSQIDSEHHNVGDAWTGRVTRDIVVGGRVVIPAGAAVSGVVSAINEGDDNDGNGFIVLDPRSIETTAGTRAIAASPVSAGASYRDEGFPSRETAIGAGAGAAIGAIVGGKKGAAIGAAAGGVGGAAMGSQRRDYEVAVAAGTSATIQLENAVEL
jgi:hypothetical protein